MDVFNYTPIGVCSKKMTFEIEDNILKDIKIYGGCPGNSLGVSKLIIGMNIDDIISKLNGIRCGMKQTSCPDQITKALAQYKKSKN